MRSDTTRPPVGRVSIYGSDPKQWEELAGWVKEHKLTSPNNRWMIQVPRIYRVLRMSSTGRPAKVNSFQDVLTNIFQV